MRHAEALAPFLLVVVEIDADDHVGTGEPQPLNHVEADAAETEDDRCRADLNLGGVDHRADPGGDAAADIADLVERRVRVDLGQRDLRQNRVVREGRAAHVMEDLVLADREARRAVRHHALTLRGPDRGAEICLARQAGRTLAAFRRVKRNDVVALLQRRDARTNVHYDAGAFVAENGREDAFGIGTGKREFIRMADAGCLDLDQDLAFARTFEINFHDLQRFSSGNGNSGAGFHERISE